MQTTFLISGFLWEKPQWERRTRRRGLRYKRLLLLTAGIWTIASMSFVSTATMLMPKRQVYTRPRHEACRSSQTTAVACETTSRPKTCTDLGWDTVTTDQIMRRWWNVQHSTKTRAKRTNYGFATTIVAIKRSLIRCRDYPDRCTAIRIEPVAASFRVAAWNSSSRLPRWSHVTRRGRCRKCTNSFGVYASRIRRRTPAKTAIWTTDGQTRTGRTSQSNRCRWIFHAWSRNPRKTVGLVPSGCCRGNTDTRAGTFRASSRGCCGCLSRRCSTCRSRSRICSTRRSRACNHIWVSHVEEYIQTFAIDRHLCRIRTHTVFRFSQF